MDGDRLVRLLGDALGRAADGTLLERVVDAAPAMLDVTGAAVALNGVDGTEGAVVAASNGDARALSELAFELGEGPGSDAFRDDAEVLVDDLARDGVGRWPIFTASALLLGGAAMYALPARIGAIRVGSLLLHRDRPAPLRGSLLVDARVLAELCSTLLLDHREGLDSDALVATGWPDRAVVHQATGMVSAQLHTGLDAALARLRSYAFAHDRTLLDVARDVVERRLRLEP